MSKAISYYDWESSLRKCTGTTNSVTFKKPKNLNAIGLSEGEFNDFMKEWRKRIYLCNFSSLNLLFLVT